MADYYPRLSSISTGLRCACPRCGRAPLYSGLLKVRDTCGGCGLDLSRYNADDGPAFFIIVLYSALVIPLAVWFEFAVRPPLWLHFIIWLPVILIGAVGLMRPIKAWLIAQQYKHSVDDLDTTR